MIRFLGFVIPGTRSMMKAEQEGRSLRRCQIGWGGKKRKWIEKNGDGRLKGLRVGMCGRIRRV